MRTSRPPILLPLAFVVIGVLLLLSNFGLVEGLDLLQYWPALLIVAGLQLLLRSDIGLTWQSQPFGITRGTVQTASLEAASGELDMKIRALRREGRLIAGTYTAHSRPRLDVRGDFARLTMQRGQTWPFSLADWEIGLARDLAWGLLLSTHLGEIDVDLRGVVVNQADMATGVGDLRVVLPEEAAEGVRARSTFGNVWVSVPPEAHAVIRVIRKPFMRALVDEKRFIQIEPNVYATPDYDQAEAVSYAEVTSTFGTVRLQ